MRLEEKNAVNKPQLEVGDYSQQVWLTSTDWKLGGPLLEGWAVRPGLWGRGARGWCLGSYSAAPTGKASGLETFEDFRKVRSGQRE